MKTIQLFLTLLCFSLGSLTAQEAPETPAAPAAPAAEPELTEEEMEAQFMEMVESFGWNRGGLGELEQAEIKIPAGFRFTGQEGSKKLMEVYGNQLSGDEKGLIAPESLDWFAIFEFRNTGRISDDDKDEIDADAILKDYKEGAKSQSKERGMSIEVVGWARPPAYNETTNNLEWGIEYLFDGSPTVNYQTHLLGRHGDMEVTLVCDPAQLETVLVDYQNLISGFTYKDGQRYDQWVEGDKVAEYGLTGLVAAGGLLAAAKLGLFAKLGKAWKLIVVGVIALAAGAKRFMGRLFGNNS